MAGDGERLEVMRQELAVLGKVHVDADFDLAERRGALEVRRLNAGDFWIGGRIAVERKTLADFAVSVVDGRLFKQAAALANSRMRGVLVLEGTAAA